MANISAYPLPQLACTKMLNLSIAVALATFSTGCVTTQGGGGNVLKETFASDDPCSNNARNIGVLAGAIGGAVLQKAIGGKNSKGVPLAGMALGATLGGFIGADMDRRRCELSKVVKANNLEVVMSDIKSIDTPVPSSNLGQKKADSLGMSFTVIDRGTQFDTGSAVPSAAARKAFGEIADKYHIRATNENATVVANTRSANMRILLVGHTDDTGSSQLNADLSEARAKAIASIFAEHGFTRPQIFFQGAGEVFPIADNRTEEGRAKNRRVEIVDLGDDAAFTAFLESRKPNVAFYRPAPPKTVTSVASAPTKASSSPAKVTTAPSGKKNASIASPSKPASTVVSINGGPSPAITTAPTSSSDGSGYGASVSKVATKAAPSPLDNIDFGGSPANGQFHAADIGKTARNKSFQIISSAYASDEAPVGSCAEDRPRVSHGVKSLASGQVYKTSEYLPGTADATWGDTINGHYLGISGVAVLRDGGQPAGRPTIKVWKNYTKGSTAKPDYVATPEVNAYQGDKALLYRVFMAEGPVRCLDMVIPNQAPNTAPGSTLVYNYNKTLYQATYSPRILR